MEYIINKFEEFTIGEINERYERCVFNSRNQSLKESIDSYIATLRTLAQKCNFCECLRDTLIRDRILLGVCNPQKRKRLLQERKLTLSKCIDICRSNEPTVSQLKAVAGAKTPEDVHQIKGKQENYRHRNYNNRNGKNGKSRKSCNFCGGKSPRSRSMSSLGQNCNKCGGRNHFAHKCKKSGKNMHNIEPTDSPAEGDEEVDYITSIAENVCSVGPSDKRHFAKEIYCEMLIDDKSVIFQVDCGSCSSINIISKSIVDKHNYKLTPTSQTLIMWNKSEVTPLGTARIIVTNPANRNKYLVEFVVVNCFP